MERLVGTIKRMLVSSGRGWRADKSAPVVAEVICSNPLSAFVPAFIRKSASLHLYRFSTQLASIFNDLRAAANNKTHTINNINTSRAAITP